MAKISVEVIRAGLIEEPPKFYLMDHQGGGRFYRTFQDVFQGDERVKEGACFFYKCKNCTELVMLDPQKGTAKLNRHANICAPLQGKRKSIMRTRINIYHYIR